MKEVKFMDVEGNAILGTISIPEHAKSVVIISYGFTSNKDRSRLGLDLQDELNKRGIGTLRYDYYGHGKQYCSATKYSVTQDVTLSKCVNSIESAISFVQSQGDYSIGLIGASFGGLLSIVATAKNPEIKALALKSSVTEPISFWKQRLGDERIKQWEKEGILHYDDCGENFELNYAYWEDVNKYDSLKLAQKIACPILIVHAGNDSVVPLKQSQDLAKIVGADVNIIEGVNHNYADLHQYNKMKNLIVDFFVKELPK